MSKQQIAVSGDRIIISGDLTFATAGSVLEASQTQFPKEGPWNCDFSQTGLCDSAGLALVLEWIKMARERRQALRFYQFPSQLQSIAAPAGLKTVLDDFLAL